MYRKKVLEDVEALMDYYCSECFLIKHHKKEMGKTYAHRFCISQCTIGERIKLLGHKLLEQPNEKHKKG